MVKKKMKNTNFVQIPNVRRDSSQNILVEIRYLENTADDEGLKEKKCFLIFIAATFCSQYLFKCVSDIRRYRESLQD